ncbi:hypothetical protein PsorP6_018105 [Peronosclerospora sorghi]|uniref:Uncharacterized protein n=1 Tax=Peronosclerospora sorghi TaxID=230839 RepID=A0ACC0WD94_9STRA|nr:hypothetical protein PsorP6_018105 [Peronosclerospora sorghi]
MHRLVQDFERKGLQLSEKKQDEVRTRKQKISKNGIKFKQNRLEKVTEVKFSLHEPKRMSDVFIGVLEKDTDDMYKITDWEWLFGMAYFYDVTIALFRQSSRS